MKKSGQREHRTSRIGNKKVYQTLAKVAVPIALQSLIGSSLNLVDNLMVGSLGESQLAAVGVSVQIYMIFYMICYGFCGGCATFMAQFWGARDLPHIRRTVGFALIVTVSMALLFFLVSLFGPQYILRIFTDIPETIEIGSDYVRTGAPCFLFLAMILPFEVALRATQQTHLPLFISIVAFVSNTFLNYVLIFGHFGAPALGVTGAALATAIARGAQFCVMYFVVFARRNLLADDFRRFFGWSRPFVRRLVRNAVPTTLNESLWGVGTSLYVAAYARIGITAYAAVQAATTIQNLLIMAAFSVGDAALILVGQKLGAGDTEGAVSLARLILRIGTLLGFLCGAVLMAVAHPIISLFNFTPAGSHYAFLILLVYSATMALVLYNAILVTGVLRAGGDTRFAMCTELSTVWFIGVPMAFLSALVFHWPVYFCVLAVKLEEAVKCIFLSHRFHSRKWVKNLIRRIDQD